MNDEPPKILEIAVQASEGPWVRGLFALLSVVSVFIEFHQAGLSLLFWILLLLALFAFVLSLIPLLVRRSKYARLVSMISNSFGLAHNREQTLYNLVYELKAFQKAKSLDPLVKNKPIQALAMKVIEGRLGVLLDAGEDDQMQVGTPLLLFQIDDRDESNQPFELRLGILEVTYVQASNNCSQAILISPINWKFWSKTRDSLKKASIVKPPPNIMLPYIPSELSELSNEDFTLILKYLGSLLHTMQTSKQAASSIKELRQ